LKAKKGPYLAPACFIIISSRALEFGLNTERLALTKIKLAIAAFRIKQAGSGQPPARFQGPMRQIL
jgi:hypothetical protein